MSGCGGGENTDETTAADPPAGEQVGGNARVQYRENVWENTLQIRIMIASASVWFEIWN